MDRAEAFPGELEHRAVWHAGLRLGVRGTPTWLAAFGVCPWVALWPRQPVCFCVFRQNCSFRPTDDSNQPPGRGVLSMHGLTYGVIRVDSEEKLSVLTVQDVGLVMPGGECGHRAAGGVGR